MLLLSDQFMNRPAIPLGPLYYQSSSALSKMAFVVEEMEVIFGESTFRVLVLLWTDGKTRAP